MGWNNQAIVLIVLEEEPFGFSGLFVYSPKISAGDLAASIAARDGADPKLNNYLAGFASYGTFQDTFYALQQTDSGLFWHEGGPLESDPYVLRQQLNLASLNLNSGFFLSVEDSLGFSPLGSSLDLLPYLILAPSGDQAGAKDTANFSAFFSSFNGVTLQLLPGTYYLDSTVSLGPDQYLRGAGMGATIVEATAALGANPALELYSSSGSNIEQFAGVSDLTIDGTNAAAGAIGLQAGDILQIGLDNVTVQNFGAGSSSTGFRFVNRVSHTEQMHGRIYASYNTNNVIFTVDGGDPSFDRMALDIFLDAGQVAGGYGAGVLFEGGALAVDIVRLGIWGNMSYGTSAAPAILSLGANSVLQGELSMGVELGGTVSAYVPQTIFFASGASIRGTGRLSFANADAFAPSNNPGGGAFWFDGDIDGDASLPRFARYGSSAFVITANGQTLPSRTSAVLRVTGASAFTGLILQPGAEDGQVLEILNAGADAQTFAASGTSNVASGASPAIPGLAGMRLVWSSAASLWYVTGTG